MDISSLQSSLSDSAKGAARAARADGEIVKAAHERREVIQNKIAALVPMVHTDHEAAAEYSDLVLERGEIDKVLGRTAE